MLVDVHFNPIEQETQDRYREAAHSIYPDVYGVFEIHHPPRLDTGIYMGSNNFVGLTREQLVEDVPVPFVSAENWHDVQECHLAYRRHMNRLYSQKYQRGPYRDFQGMGAYGVCDTPEQLLRDFPHFADDEVPRVLTFKGVWREHQSSQGGFRYHKNGKYVGRQKPRSEYLYDDKHIDMVCIFHVYRVIG